MRNLRVKDLLAFQTSQPSVTSADATLREVVEKLIEDRTTREVYLLDADGKFFGVITLRRLAQYVFSQHVPDQSSVTALLELVSARNAGDLAIGKSAHVVEDDSLGDALDVMFRFDVDEVPVVDSERVIVGCLGLLEILVAWHAGKLDDLTG